MTNALITIVVPVYNVEKYLDRCITSIVNQTYRNLEIILVDDGSPDRCPQMCEDWAKKDSRIRVVHKKNAGLGMARNTGIEHASGAYICFFDSDDYVAPDLIEKAYQQMIAESAEIVIYGKCSVGKDGKISKCLIPKSEKLSYEGDEVCSVFLPDLIDNRHKDVIVKNLCFSTWICLYSMDLVNRTHWRFVSERQNISEDSYSLIWLYQHVKKVAILPEILYYYCENETSLTRIYRTDRYEKIKHFYVDCIELANQAGYSQKVQMRIAGLYLSLSIAAMKQIVAAKMSGTEKKKLLNQIMEDEIMRAVLASVDIHNERKARKILFLAMRYRLHAMVFLLVRMQAMKRA